MTDQVEHTDAAREILQEENVVFYARDKLLALGLSGYTEYYLYRCANHHNLSTTAKTSAAVALARIDLKCGTPIEMLVFYCCAFAPTLTADRRCLAQCILDLSSEPDRVERCLNYRDANGTTPLLATMELAVWYNNENNGPPSSEWMEHVTATVNYLIRLGEETGVDMEQIIEKERPDGLDLNQLMAQFAPETCHELISRNRPPQRSILRRSFTFIQTRISTLSTTNFNVNHVSALFAGLAYWLAY